MAAARTFCPRCGASVSPEDALGRPDADRAREPELCRDCYFAAFDLVETASELRVRTCTGCGAVHRDGSWETPETDDELDLAIDAVAEGLRVHRDAREVSWTVEPDRQDQNSLVLACTVRGVVHERPVTETHEVTVGFDRETCQRCGRMAGKSYAATVQVRASERVATAAERDRALDLAQAVVTEAARTGDRDAFVSKVVDRPEGVDIRVSTTKLGARIADRITAVCGGKYDASETLITEDGDGRGVYRVTYAVRLPRFPRGTIIDAGDGPVVISGVSDHVTGRDLATGDRMTIDDVTDADLEKVGDVAEATETTVVAVTDEHSVQVLDPATHRTVTVPRPPDMSIDGDTVLAVSLGSGVYLVPPSVRSAADTDDS